MSSLDSEFPAGSLERKNKREFLTLFYCSLIKTLTASNFLNPNPVRTL